MSLRTSSSLALDQTTGARSLSVRTGDSKSDPMSELDPSMTKLAKRSVVIAGHKTSISLENAFWASLKTAARRRSMTVNELVTRIDGSRQGNLSSALRVFLLLEPHAAPQMSFGPSKL